MRGTFARLYQWTHNSVFFCAQLLLHSPSGRGRFCVADRDIKSGELIAVESPFTWLLDKEEAKSGSTCWHCFRSAISPIPCLSCAGEEDEHLSQGDQSSLESIMIVSNRNPDSCWCTICTIKKWMWNFATQIIFASQLWFVNILLFWYFQGSSSAELSVEKKLLKHTTIMNAAWQTRYQ